jgi:DNA-binding winged helix-turn-helix (wHTH) protein
MCKATVGDMRLNADTRIVLCGSVPIEITGSEFTILEVLMRTAGRIVSRDELAAVTH